MATWLIAHSLVAWSIRARPQLPLRSNPAFPGWALTASLAAVVLTATPAGRAFGLDALPLLGWVVVLASAAGSAALGAAGRAVADLGCRL